MAFIITCLAFIVSIAILVTVHEFGHFWVARRCGVKVLRFSVGFGKPLLTYVDKHQTEYVIGLLPLGGYVQMLDESEGVVSEDLLPYAFNRKPIWKRIAILAAGPFFNLLFAMMAFWIIYSFGVKQLIPVVGFVPPDSIAGQAGLTSDQEIVAIEDEKTHNWAQISMALMEHYHSSKIIKLTLRDFADNTISSVNLDISRWKMNPLHPNPLKALGIYRAYPKSPARIYNVIDGTPASAVGIRKGDIVTRINDKPIKYWGEFADYIRGHYDAKSFILEIEREQQKITVDLTPIKRRLADGSSVAYLGVESIPVNYSADMLRIERYSPLLAWQPALERTLRLTLISLQVVGKLLMGKLSVQAVAGPVGIAVAAGKTIQGGVVQFLGFLGMISISLAVLNIMPLPVLDGGHIVFYLIEALRGRPLSDLIRVRAMWFGVYFLLGLMCITFFNDLVRFFG